MDEEIEKELDKIRNLKGAPLTFKKLRLMESDPEAFRPMKLVESTFHQTTKHAISPAGKPVSKIIERKNLRK